MLWVASFFVGFSYSMRIGLKVMGFGLVDRLGSWLVPIEVASGLIVGALKIFAR